MEEFLSSNYHKIYPVQCIQAGDVWQLEDTQCIEADAEGLKHAGFMCKLIWTVIFGTPLTGKEDQIFTLTEHATSRWSVIL
jgi:hypothetical protein